MRDVLNPSNLRTLEKMSSERTLMKFLLLMVFLLGCGSDDKDVGESHKEIIRVRNLDSENCEDIPEAPRHRNGTRLERAPDYCLR